MYKTIKQYYRSQQTVDDAYRLEVWCTRGEDRRYGDYAILGANQGKDFGEHIKIILKH